MFRSFIRPLAILSLVLLLPIVPFVLFGERLEAWFTGLFDPPPSQATTAALVAGTLATDVFLPVPSSFVSTLGGARLGTLAGTAASWLGMTVGGVAGYALARRFGRPLVGRFASAEDLARLDALSSRAGPTLVVVTRAVPIVAEATVLLVGMHRLSWRRFLPALVASNLGIALAYSAFGELASEQEWLPTALGASVAAPLGVTAAARWLLSRRRVGP